MPRDVLVGGRGRALAMQCAKIRENGMIGVYHGGGAGTRAKSAKAGAAWFDAVSPTGEELAELEKTAGFELPTWDDMSEIELSSRFYREDGSLVMIAYLIPKSEFRSLPTRPAAFILQKDRLITIRRDEFASFDRAAKGAATSDRQGCPVHLGFLFDLLEETVSDRADDMEYIIRVLDDLAERLFSLPRRNNHKVEPAEPLDLKETLKQMGGTGETLSNIRESLASLQRMLHFIKAHVPAERLGECAAALESANRDIDALSDEAGFLMNRLSFYLDATLGMINIEENQVVKVLSAMAMIFCPPMLIAGIYGMNFDFMPELHWSAGYFLALAVILATVLFQIWYLKKRKWL